MKKNNHSGFSCAWILPAVKLGLGVIPVFAPAFSTAFAQDTRDADIFGSAAVVVDAGIGSPSDAAMAMEVGADAVLVAPALMGLPAVGGLFRFRICGMALKA